jgi:hypothetical protein
MLEVAISRAKWKEPVIKPSASPFSSGLIRSFPFDGRLQGFGDALSIKTSGVIHFENLDSGALFDGASYIEVPDKIFAGLSTWSVSVWMLPGSNNITGCIVEKGPSKGYYLGANAGRVKVGISEEDGASPAVVSKTIFNAGQWHLVVGTFDGKNLRIYVDGKLENQTNVSGKPLMGDQPITIGAQSGGKEFFRGNLKNLSFYGRALSEEEISSLNGEGR